MPLVTRRSDVVCLFVGSDMVGVAAIDPVADAPVTKEVNDAVDVVDAVKAEDTADATEAGAPGVEVAASW